MKVQIAHADTCLPDYWAGHHRPHVSIPVHRSTRFCDVRQDLRTEIAQGAVMGSDEDAHYLSADVGNDPAYADELTRAVYAAIKCVKGAQRGKRYAFRDLPTDAEDVQAYFVIMVEGERRSMETHANWPDSRVREGEPRAARIIFRDGETRYFVAGTEYGYLHTTSGELRTWKTASGARKAAQRYMETHA